MSYYLLQVSFVWISKIHVRVRFSYMISNAVKMTRHIFLFLYFSPNELSHQRVGLSLLLLGLWCFMCFLQLSIFPFVPVGAQRWPGPASSLLHRSQQVLAVTGRRLESKGWETNPVERPEKPQRPCKYGKGIFKIIFFFLFLSGASGNVPACWEDLALLHQRAGNPASQAVYHRHGLRSLVYFVKRNKRDEWLTFSCCLGWGRGWAVDSGPPLSRKRMRSHHATHTQLTIWWMVL